MENKINKKFSLYQIILASNLIALAFASNYILRISGFARTFQIPIIYKTLFRISWLFLIFFGLFFNFWQGLFCIFIYALLDDFLSGEYLRRFHLYQSIIADIDNDSQFFFIVGNFFLGVIIPCFSYLLLGVFYYRKDLKKLTNNKSNLKHLIILFLLATLLHTFGNTLNGWTSYFSGFQEQMKNKNYTVERNFSSFVILTILNLVPVITTNLLLFILIVIINPRIKDACAQYFNFPQENKPHFKVNNPTN